MSARTPLPAARPANLAPFERLVKMLERELELAGQGRTHELSAAVAQRSAYLRSLPRPAPAEAQPLLWRASALHSRVSIETQRLAEAIERRRGARRMARKMARTYVPPPVPRQYSTSA